MAEYSVWNTCSSRNGISTAAVLCRGMDGALPSSSSPPALSVILSLVSAISRVLSFLLRLLVLGASGWAAVHEDMFSIFYLVSILFRGCNVLVCWL
jgi:hypothetical protein